MKAEYVTRQQAQRMLRVGRTKFYQVAGKLTRYRASDGDRKVYFDRAEVLTLKRAMGLRTFRKVGQ